MGSGGFVAGIRETRDPLDSSVEFLASQHYIVKRGGITLDSTAVTADEDGHKIVKGGTVLGMVTATGKYVPYDDAAVDGSEVAKGILFPGDVNLEYGDVVAGMLIHGSVIEARCTGVDAAAKTDMTGRVIFQ